MVNFISIALVAFQNPYLSLTDDAFMELNSKQRFFYFFPVLFCFCLPFGSLILSGIIILWGISSFFNLNKEHFKKGLRDRTLQLLFVFFLTTCISALFSDNKSDALFNVEVKLSLLFIPYFIFCFKWPGEIVKKCLISFVSGCFFACLYLIIRATVFSLNGHPEYFFYTLFSDLIHASYFAMYLILAISVVVLYYPVWYRNEKNIRYLSTVFLITFSLVIFLCSSKLGLISFFVCMPLLLYHKFKSSFTITRALIAVLVLVILIFTLSKIFPESFNRLDSITSMSAQPVDKTSSESTAVRILIWDQCLHLIKNNFIFGVGVGDVNDVLFESYKQNGITGALQHKLNAHNQYLQTFVGMGCIGFILLLSVTLFQFIKAILNRNFILTITMLLIVLNFLVESMLQTSAGTLFFVFFLCIFSLPHLSNELKN